MEKVIKQLFAKKVFAGSTVGGYGEDLSRWLLPVLGVIGAASIPADKGLDKHWHQPAHRTILASSFFGLTAAETVHNSFSVYGLGKK